jgi:hypothetical protein
MRMQLNFHAYVIKNTCVWKFIFLRMQITIICAYSDSRIRKEFFICTMQAPITYYESVGCMRNGRDLHRHNLVDKL